MNKDDMYNAIGDIKVEYLEEAEAFMFVKKNSHLCRRFIAVAACLCLLLCSSAVCYAANVGGIQRQIQLWIDGDKTAAVIDFTDSGKYTLSYKDNEGNVYSQSGGGVKTDQSGSIIPATEDELLEEVLAPNVAYKDGKAVLRYNNTTLDITNLFVDNMCYITITQDGKPLYVTVKYLSGVATSPNRYLSPSEFN